jgi:RNA polymerase sigma-70 factor (ECF subfamily)
MTTSILQLPVARVEHGLLARLRRRDAGTFEALVRQHQDRVYHFCCRMLGDQAEAAELTQEVFLSAHQHLDTFRAEATVSTWLYRIARNQCLNRLTHLRRRGGGRQEPYDEASELAITEAQGGAVRPDEALEARREQIRVQRAIAQLDEHARALVILRDLEGLSYEEIVGITGLPEGTVKSRLHRAREKLAGLLGAVDPAGEVSRAP